MFAIVQQPMQHKMSISDLSDENWVISSGSEQTLLSRLKPLFY